MRTRLRTNAFRRPVVGRLSKVTSASPDDVYDVLADLSTHLDWGGREIRGSARLLTLDASEAPATVGTEFESTGQDPLVRMTDRSVVTEATRSTSFEFVTDSAWELKRSGKGADFTIVHRYEIEPLPAGCRVTYSFRATRASALPGVLAMFRIPLVRTVAGRMSVRSLRQGFGNLLRAAEQRPSVSP
jgi:hypothetical protein